MARVLLNNISKSWGSAVGVKHMSLDIADGEFLVLLGPSGCGKTTTMRMVAGLEDPSTGEVWIGDRCVNGLEPKDRDVAMVFQSY
ncbi:MAG: ABC transporter ATP-binding protein, partial [Betaproteobacteria bacterium]|nr:ABC transporter ATP-binding protein [Betaproteobacteria bacterium]